MKKKTIKLTLVSVMAVALAGISYATPAQTFSADVTLTQGIYQGMTTKDGKGIHWLGIPYAKAPVGTLRWQRPQFPDASHRHFLANKVGNVCPQISHGKYIGNEDCLNLNIYRPNNNETLPVLVYIHGGNNQTGKADEFNPTQLAQDINAIVITVNYRLGALGFNPLKAIKTVDAIQSSGNFTLLDQAKMLEWVRSNVRQFGGDPHHVTVSGFSAGGRDVMAMLISPVFKGKFDQAIVFSGGMTTSPVTDSQTVFKRAFAKLVVEDGIRSGQASAVEWLGTASKKVKDYLYHLDARRVATLMQNAGIRMKVFPHLYLDGTVLPSKGFATKTYNSVPTMMLTGHDEFSLFSYYDPYFLKTDWKTDTEKNREFQFVYHYGGMLYRLFNVAASAEKMASSFHAPIYAGQFRYGSNPMVVGHSMDKFGSYHGVFLPLLDSSVHADLFGRVFTTPGALALAKVFKQHLASFIRHGYPDGHQTVTWKPWNRSTLASGESIYVMDANKHHFIAYRTEPTYSFHDVNEAIDRDASLDKTTKTTLLHQVMNGRWFSRSLDKYSGADTRW